MIESNGLRDWNAFLWVNHLPCRTIQACSARIKCNFSGELKFMERLIVPRTFISVNRLA